MNRWFLIGLIFAGLVAAETLAAQSPSTPPQRQQRAPGVPMAPDAGELQKREPDAERARILRERLARDRSPPPEPNREIPMPKPVPSIIAPAR